MSPRLLPRRPIGARRMRPGAPPSADSRSLALWRLPLALIFRRSGSLTRDPVPSLACPGGQTIVLTPRFRLALALSTSLRHEHWHIAVQGADDRAAPGAPRTTRLDARHLHFYEPRAGGRRDPPAPAPMGAQTKVALPGLARPAELRIRRGLGPVAASAHSPPPPRVLPRAHAPAHVHPKHGEASPLRRPRDLVLRTGTRHGLATSSSALAGPGARGKARWANGEWEPPSIITDRWLRTATTSPARSLHPGPLTDRAPVRVGRVAVAHGVTELRRTAPAAPDGARDDVAFRFPRPAGTFRSRAPDGSQPTASPPLEYRRSVPTTSAQEDTHAPRPAAPPPAVPAIDMDALSRDVIGRIEKRLRIERERHGRV